MRMRSLLKLVITNILEHHHVLDSRDHNTILVPELLLLLPKHSTIIGDIDSRHVLSLDPDQLISRNVSTFVSWLVDKVTVVSFIARAVIPSMIHFARHSPVVLV